jgi:hypothetical protein
MTERFPLNENNEMYKDNVSVGFRSLPIYNPLSNPKPKQTSNPFLRSTCCMATIVVFTIIFSALTGYHFGSSVYLSTSPTESKLFTSIFRSTPRSLEVVSNKERTKKSPFISCKHDEKINYRVRVSLHAELPGMINHLNGLLLRDEPASPGDSFIIPSLSASSKYIKNINNAQLFQEFLHLQFFASIAKHHPVIIMQIGIGDGSAFNSGISHMLSLVTDPFDQEYIRCLLIEKSTLM